MNDIESMSNDSIGRSLALDLALLRREAAIARDWWTTRSPAGVPSFCRSKKGTEMTVTGSLNTLVIRTSICNHPLASTVKLDLAVVMPNPISLWMSNAAARA